MAKLAAEIVPKDGIIDELALTANPSAPTGMFLDLRTVNIPAEQFKHLPSVAEPCRVTIDVCRLGGKFADS